MRPVVAQGPGDSVKALKGTAAKGMILPFAPMALTFGRVSYYVAFPKVLPMPTLSAFFSLTHLQKAALVMPLLLACAMQAYRRRFLPCPWVRVSNQAIATMRRRWRIRRRRAARTCCSC